MALDFAEIHIFGVYRHHTLDITHMAHMHLVFLDPLVPYPTEIGNHQLTYNMDQKLTGLRILCTFC